MTAIITGAPKIAVTVLILISVGANTIRARRSQNMQNTSPPKKHAGIMMIGFAVRNNRFTICGTAIPTNDTGPANAVTTADKMLCGFIRGYERVWKKYQSGPEGEYCKCYDKQISCWSK